jgi:hypothetical protein
MPRELLPNRRTAETFKLRFGDQRGAYHVTCGYYADGRLGELFISTNKIGSAADAVARDCAIVTSIALQYGAPLDVIGRALTREGNGKPSTVIGAVVDRLMEGTPP